MSLPTMATLPPKKIFMPMPSHPFLRVSTFRALAASAPLGGLLALLQASLYFGLQEDLFLKISLLLLNRRPLLCVLFIAAGGDITLCRTLFHRSGLCPHPFFLSDAELFTRVLFWFPSASHLHKGYITFLSTVRVNRPHVNSGGPFFCKVFLGLF